MSATRGLPSPPAFGSEPTREAWRRQYRAASERRYPDAGRFRVSPGCRWPTARRLLMPADAVAFPADFEGFHLNDGEVRLNVAEALRMAIDRCVLVDTRSDEPYPTLPAEALRPPPAPPVRRLAGDPVTMPLAAFEDADVFETNRLAHLEMRRRGPGSDEPPPRAA